MKTVCNKNMCSGCMACKDVCPTKAISVIDSIEFFNAVIDDKCINCGACLRVCPLNNVTSPKYPVYWAQGWAKDEKVRQSSSSGGFAKELSRTMIKKNGYVCSCIIQNGAVVFCITNSIEDINKFTGSKYVKSNPAGIYKKIKQLLKEGHEVLFIGLPCQSAAVQNFVGASLRERLTTVDLICHGTPSAKLLEDFLSQYKLSLKTMRNIKFRIKNHFNISENNKDIIANGVLDRYTLGFLKSLFYTENCYNCRYATIKRISDITIGDSWGSNHKVEEIKKGISLALCQTEKGKKLLLESELSLFPVDLENAINNNDQLLHPSIKPVDRDYFFKEFFKGGKINNIIFKIYPKICIKQIIKEMLVRLKLYNRT